MDNNNQKTIEYIKSLPQSIQDFVYESAWEERTSDVGKKYSLNETQTDELINNVLYVLIGLDKPDVFLANIVKELNISSLLAEQIMQDLDTRVFEYALKSIEVRDKKKTTLGEERVDEDMPEVRPVITPMVEEGEKVHVLTYAKPEVKAEESRNAAPEIIQRPISVPRYTGVPLEEEVVTSATPVKTDDTPIDTPKQADVKVAPAPVPEPVKKYSVDPYREPIE